MPSDPGDLLEIDGRRLSIRHLERVVFPRTGTTKAEVLAYYVRVSDVMLPHLRERCCTCTATRREWRARASGRRTVRATGPSGWRRRRCGAARRAPTFTTA